MAFQVEPSMVAMKEIQEIFDWLRDRSPLGAERWYQELCAAIETLESSVSIPGHLAQESEWFEDELRHLVFKTPRGRPYRILFTVDSSRIIIHSVRGRGRNYLEPTEH